MQNQNNYNYPPVSDVDPLEFVPKSEPMIETPQKPSWFKEKLKKIKFGTWVKIFFWTFILIIAGILYWSPKTILEPLKYYLNGEYGNEIPNYVSQDKEFNLKNFVSEDGSVKLNENELFRLVNSGPNFKFDRVEVEDGKLTLFKNLAKDGNPLWLGMTIEEVNNEFVFSRVGFGRIAVPKFLVDLVMQKIYGKLINTDNSGVSGLILQQFLGGQIADIIHPGNVEFKQDYVLVKIQSKWSFLGEIDMEGKIDDLVKKYENYDLNGFKDWLANIGVDSNVDTNNGK